MGDRRKAGFAGALLAAGAIVGLALPSTALAAAKGRTLAVEVRVTFTDSGLAVAPGTITSQLASFDAAFVVVNKGRHPHVLAIKGPGLGGTATKSGTRVQRIPAGGSTTLRLKLLTGAYQLSDAAGLRGGSVRWFVVRPAAAGNAGGSAKSSTVTNPAYPPGASSSNSAMACDI